MTAADPTYPLYPIACILLSALLLLSLTTSLIRQSWNLGAAFLCFWLCLESLFNGVGVSAILWSDNYDIKLHVYCDIVTHLQRVASVVKSLCTLIIVRRLYLIASLRSAVLPTSRERRKDAIVEWTLGLAIPLLVGGPIYYIVQEFRFVVVEGSGCMAAVQESMLAVLVLYSWDVVPPLISLFIYYPKVFWVFYRQSRDLNRFLRSNDSISRTSYIRIFALSGIHLLFTLPVGIPSLASNVVQVVRIHREHGWRFSFYTTWDDVHRDWAPIAFALPASVRAADTLTQYQQWISPALCFVIFCLFGLTADARATYMRAVLLAVKWFGWTPSPKKAREDSEIGFSTRWHEDPLDANPSFARVETMVGPESGATVDGKRQRQVC